MSPQAMFGALMVAHVICDYPLQGDFLSRAKNRLAPVAGAPWYQALGAHALIHAGAVWLITGHWWLGMAEFAFHAATDDAKCAGRLSFNQDQAIHVLCKVAWVTVAVMVAR